MKTKLLGRRGILIRGGPLDSRTSSSVIKSIVSQDDIALVTGSFTLKCRTLCQEYVVAQKRWSLMAVVFQDGFHCISAQTNEAVMVSLIERVLHVCSQCEFWPTSPRKPQPCFETEGYRCKLAVVNDK